MTPSLAMQVADRLARVRARIDDAGGDWHRVKIIAVTKGFDVTAVAAAHGAGCVDVGENYAAELETKGELSEHLRPPVVWHYLGAVQRKKVKNLARHVALWHGVDRVEEGVEIARRAPGAAALVQVNLAGAVGRGGCQPADAAALVDGLRHCGLEVRGLMGVAGRTDPRRDFARLAELASSLGLRELSMGMSGDLEAAVAEGSTMVRVGTALFGARPEAPQLRR